MVRRATCISTASVLRLLLQPFLAPPYPWLSGYAGREECFSRVEQWGSRPAWLKPVDAAERAAIRQWLFAVRRGLNQKQMQAYKVGDPLLPVQDRCINLSIVSANNSN